MKRLLLLSVFFLSLAPAGCRENQTTSQKSQPYPGGRFAAPATAELASHDTEPPPPPPEGRLVYAYLEGQVQKVTEPEALRKGLTVIDLSNFWVPFIFSEQDSEQSSRLPNEFRSIYRKLANDWPYESRTEAAAREALGRRFKAASTRDGGVPPESTSDENDGEEPDAGDEEEEFAGGLGDAQNYLEVYGILPTLSVLRRRAIQELNKPCLKEIDYEKFNRFSESIQYENNEAARGDAKQGKKSLKKLELEMKRLHLTDPLELANHPKNHLALYRIEDALRFDSIREAQKLLSCEGLYKKGMEKKYWAGGLDWKTHQALLAFDHKNRIFGWGFFGQTTWEALRRKPEERLYSAFLRVLAERIIEATGIIEDGSAVLKNDQRPKFKDAKGVEREVPNLVAEFSAAALHHMDLKTPEKVIEFLKGHSDADFDTLFVALPLPEKPPYYSDAMDLRVEIDRGDIWYDAPYNEEGKPRAQPREIMPTLRLYVKWNDQDIMLAKMNTTIGGWRSELAPDGYEYFKYKNSDVGSYVWKDIVAGPVWLPPDTTPTRDLIKEVTYRKQRVKVPSYDEFGPWYASAYGLVAAFHVKATAHKSGRIEYIDNGIRTHGSVDYNSIIRRFSHGCHRLYNHLAIRLFDFVLRHHKYTRIGQIPAGYSHRVVTEEGEEFIINLNTKGYKYELIEPVPVEVFAGTVRGRQKIPIAGYLPKADVEYGEDAQFLPEGYARKKGDAGVVPATEQAASTSTAIKPNAPILKTDTTGKKAE